MSELAFLSATELAAKVAAKEISAVELLQMYLQRVDTYNPDLMRCVSTFATKPWPTLKLLMPHWLRDSPWGHFTACQ